MVDDDLFGSDDDEEQQDKELQRQLEDSDDQVADVADELQDVDNAEDDRAETGAQDDEEAVDEAEELKRQEDAKPPYELELPLVAQPPRQELHLMKLSNVISAETKPFDPDSFVLEQENYADEQGRVLSRLRTGNVIRWRYKKTASGRLEKQSNARFVKWSDGTMQLLLGEEVFNCKPQDITGDNAVLFVSTGDMQAHVPLESKLLVRPADLNSATHRRLAELSNARHSRISKIGAHMVLTNPEKEMSERLRAEQDQIQSRAVLNRQRVAAARQYHKPPPSSFSARYLEDALDEEDGGDEYMEAEPARGRRTYDEAGEAEQARRLQAAKRNAPAAKRRRIEEESDEDDFVVSEEEEEEAEAEEGGSEEEAAEEEEEERPRKGQARPAPKPVEAPKPKARKGVVVSSDEED